MSKSVRAAIAGLLCLAAVVLFGACQTGPKTEVQAYETEDGAVVVETTKLEAKVVAVNSRERTLTLKPKYRDEVTFKADERVANFDQIQVGDEVHAEVIEEIAISLIPGGAATSVGEAAGVALAPLGAKPGIVMVDSVEVTAEIIAIDAHEHTVTLEFLDGSTKTVQVGKHRDLTRVKLGDSVRIVITEGVAIRVEKPQQS